jgi:hypothetical protein
MDGTIPPLSHKSSGRGAYLNTRYVFMTLYLVKHKDFTLLPSPAYTRHTLCFAGYEPKFANILRRKLLITYTF